MIKDELRIIYGEGAEPELILRMFKDSKNLDELREALHVFKYKEVTSGNVSTLPESVTEKHENNRVLTLGEFLELQD